MKSVRQNHNDFMKNYKLISRTQYFKTELKNIFTEPIDKIDLK